jgi:hypothetical protein
MVYGYQREPQIFAMHDGYKCMLVYDYKLIVLSECKYIKPLNGLTISLQSVADDVSGPQGVFSRRPERPWRDYKLEWASDRTGRPQRSMNQLTETCQETIFRIAPTASLAQLIYFSSTAAGHDQRERSFRRAS